MPGRNEGQKKKIKFGGLVSDENPQRNRLGLIPIN